MTAAALIRADSLAIPLADRSVHLSISSPPYFALRSYQDDGEHFDGQIGSEPSPDDFLRALWRVYDEVYRVLRDDGSCFVNLGDKYAGSGGHNNSGVARPPSQASTLDSRKSLDRMGEATQAARDAARLDQRKATRRSAPDRYNQTADVLAKSLMGLPWRFAMGLIQPTTYRNPIDPPVAECWHDQPCSACRGSWPQWILRAEFIWSKPNGMPESVTDRVRRSHEQWFHLTKAGRYFAAVDEVREPQTGPAFSGRAGINVDRYDPGTQGWASGGGGFVMRHRDYNALGRVPGSVATFDDEAFEVPADVLSTLKSDDSATVWSVATEPLQVPDAIGVDHFAAFPQEWPRRFVLGWSPSGICTACGEGRRPVSTVDWSKVPHEMVERRVLTAKAVSEWVASFAGVCRERGISNAALDAATGTAGMGGHWTTQSQPAVPTPEKWAQIVEAFGPMLDELTAVVLSTQMVPVALAYMDGDTDKAVSGRNAMRTAKNLSADEYRTITGFACACETPDAPTTPAVVLDPFGGTGTTAMVARALGRYGVHLDLSADYLRLATWRVFRSGHATKSVRRTNAERKATKAPPVSAPYGADSLFGGPT